MRLHLVDVFGTTPLTGNPLAVVFDTENLETDHMLRLTDLIQLRRTDEHLVGHELQLPLGFRLG